MTALRSLVSRATLIDALATGASLHAIARALGYHDHAGVRAAMARFGITRAVSGDGVVVIVARPQVESARYHRRLHAAAVMRAAAGMR